MTRVIQARFEQPALSNWPHPLFKIAPAPLGQPVQVRADRRRPIHEIRELSRSVSAGSPGAKEVLDTRPVAGRNERRGRAERLVPAIT